jgi:hypothetical protein
VFARLYCCAAAVPDAATVPADETSLNAIQTTAPEDAATTLLDTANASSTATAAAGAALNQAAATNATGVAAVCYAAAAENPVATGKVLSSAFEAAHGKNATNNIASVGRSEQIYGLTKRCRIAQKRDIRHWLCQGNWLCQGEGLRSNIFASDGNMCCRLETSAAGFQPEFAVQACHATTCWCGTNLLLGCE